MDPKRGSQLSKVRTYRSDMEQANPSLPKSLAVTPIVPAKPKVMLPPVLAPQKPLVPIPPKAVASIVPPTAIKTPDPDKAAAAPQDPAPTIAAAAGDIDRFLGKQAALDTGRLNVLDDGSEVLEGTIITDQKRQRFSLLPAIWEAMTAWFQQNKEKLEERVEEKRRAIPTVRPLEERRAIIEKAAQQSALAPRDDHKKLARALPSEPEPRTAVTPLTVIKKKEPATPSWSHFEGVTEAVPKPLKTLAPAETEVVRSVPVTPPAIPPPPIKQPEPVPPPVETPASPPRPTPTVPVTRSIPPPPPPPIPPIRTDQPTSVSPARSAPAPLNNARPVRAGAVSNLWRYAVIVLIAVLAGGSGIVLSWRFLADPDESVSLPIATESLTPIDTSSMRSDGQVRQPLPQQRAQLYQLLEETGTASGVTVFIPTIADGPTERAATTEEVLRTLAWDASAPLLRAIENIYLGTYDSTAFIRLQVGAFDTAFGGMLAAEPNLSRDLVPLFGEEVTGTFDAETATVRPPFFADDIVQNHDVRILRDELQKERVVYGFVNQHTLIITPDRETFRAIIGTIR